MKINELLKSKKGAEKIVAIIIIIVIILISLIIIILIITGFLGKGGEFGEQTLFGVFESGDTVVGDMFNTEGEEASSVFFFTLTFLMSYTKNAKKKS